MTPRFRLPVRVDHAAHAAPNHFVVPAVKMTKKYVRRPINTLIFGVPNKYFGMVKELFK